MTESGSTTLPPRHQERQPGIKSQMHPQPQYDYPERGGCGRLAGRVAIVTGGDSGIGRAISIAFAKESADIAIVYLEETGDAEKTREEVTRHGQRCVLIRGDVADEAFCREAVDRTVRELGRLDVLVNNAGQQYEEFSIEDISRAELQQVFAVNLFSMFYMAKAALEHMPAGSAIVNTASVTAYRGKPSLLDYSSRKGGIVAFTRSLALQLVSKGIRVNAVAPGPIWTPLIPASFSADEVTDFGKSTPMGRPGQPAEVAPSYVFLASGDASYMTGQVLYPNGGEMVES